MIGIRFRGRPGAAGAAAMLAAALAAPPPSPAGGVIDPPRAPAAGAWRVPERDAVNCLYFLLRFHQLPVSYDRVLAALPVGGRGAGFGQVRDAARRLGLSCRVVRCGVADLVPLNRPVIVYMEGAGRGRGSFFVLLNISEPDDRGGLAVAMNGGLATVRQIPLDDFRREWSGYILVPEEPAPGARRAAVLGAAALLGVCLMAARRRRPRAPAAPGPEDPGRAGSDAHPDA